MFHCLGRTSYARRKVVGRLSSRSVLRPDPQCPSELTCCPEPEEDSPHSSSNDTSQSPPTRLPALPQDLRAQAPPPTPPRQESPLRCRCARRRPDSRRPRGGAYPTGDHGGNDAGEREQQVEADDTVPFLEPGWAHFDRRTTRWIWTALRREGAGGGDSPRGE